MKKDTQPKEIDEMLPNYDFTGGVRGKYAERYRQGTNLILLEPDVAEMFTDSESVNRTLRAAMEILKANPKRGN